MLCQGEELRHWIEDAIGQDIPTPATFIAKVGEDGLPVCVAGFADWRVFDVEVYFWCAGTMTRDFLRRVARYAFEELNVRYVRCRAASDMPEWIEEIKRLGFVHEGTQRGGFDGDIDLLWFGIKREEFIL